MQSGSVEESGPLGRPVIHRVGGQDQDRGLIQRTRAVQDYGPGPVEARRPAVLGHRLRDLSQAVACHGGEPFIAEQGARPVQGPCGQCLICGRADATDRVGGSGDIEELVTAGVLGVVELPQ
ncbi:hypothetical protein [Streptomyces sp. NBRC 110611]|uniref:hypothetical protein n=1 Tax=Streptomyces sp. NBRC 110611 TaxID=1621259 RepID=UPI0011BED842|nr:hypothetical protein [Streptomyces sp. NBRC 110611]